MHINYRLHLICRISHAPPPPMLPRSPHAAPAPMIPRAPPALMICPHAPTLPSRSSYRMPQH